MALRPGDDSAAAAELADAVKRDIVDRPGGASPATARTRPLFATGANRHPVSGAANPLRTALAVMGCAA